jgi:hypothetical protein
MAITLQEAWRRTTSSSQSGVEDEQREMDVESSSTTTTPLQDDSSDNWHRIAVVASVLLKLGSEFEAKFVVWEPLARKARAWLYEALRPMHPDQIQLLIAVPSAPA